MPAVSTAGERAADARLGRALRAARRARGMTLVEVAAASGLSQPFLSQLELGRSRPSMRSLHRIAVALGTTQQELLAAAAGPSPDVLVRGADADLVDVESGGARLLMHDESGTDITEFVGAPPEFGDYFTHDGTELLYVARGTIEVDVRQDGHSTFSVLQARDTLSYPGRSEHRFRQVGPDTCVVLVIHRGR